MLAAWPGHAQVSNIVATKLFGVSLGNERNALAFEDTTQRLYTVDTSDRLRVYALDGMLVLGRSPCSPRVDPARPASTFSEKRRR